MPEHCEHRRSLHVEVTQLRGELQACHDAALNVLPFLPGRRFRLMPPQRLVRDIVTALRERWVH